MTQTKLTEEDAKMLGNAACIILRAFSWGDTDEGREYWDGVYKHLRNKEANRTSDGKPCVEPEPPIPNGFRRATGDEWKRKDVQFWHQTQKTWVSRPIQGKPFDAPECNTHYIVPIDPPLTDEDSCVWPRLLVMVRDDEHGSWIGPLQLQGVSPNGIYHYTTNDPKTGICEFYCFARRATPEEIEAAK